MVKEKEVTHADILVLLKKLVFFKYFPADIFVTCHLSEKCQKFPEALWNT